MDKSKNQASVIIKLYIVVVIDIEHTYIHMFLCAVIMTLTCKTV